MAKHKKPRRADSMLDVDKVLADHKADLERSRREAAINDPWNWGDRYGPVGNLRAQRESTAHAQTPVRSVPPVGGPPNNPVTSSRQRKARRAAVVEASKKSQNGGKSRRL